MRALASGAIKCGGAFYTLDQLFVLLSFCYETVRRGPLGDDDGEGRQASHSSQRSFDPPQPPDLTVGDQEVQEDHQQEGPTERRDCRVRLGKLATVRIPVVQRQIRHGRG